MSFRKIRKFFLKLDFNFFIKKNHLHLWSFRRVFACKLWTSLKLSLFFWFVLLTHNLTSLYVTWRWESLQPSNSAGTSGYRYRSWLYTWLPMETLLFIWILWIVDKLLSLPFYIWRYVSGVRVCELMLKRIIHV